MKRGLGETCQDGARKKAKYLRDIEDARKPPSETFSFCLSDSFSLFFLLLPAPGRISGFRCFRHALHSINLAYFVRAVVNAGKAVPTHFIHCK